MNVRCFKNSDCGGNKYRRSLLKLKLFRFYSNLLKMAIEVDFTWDEALAGTTHPSLNWERKIYHREFFFTFSKQRRWRKFHVTAKITQTVFPCLPYYETCKEFVEQKFTSVISTYYYRHIPTLCRDVDRTSVLSSVFFTMHLFAIFSWIYSFLFSVSLYWLLGKKSRNRTTDFRSAYWLLFIIIKDPLFLLFSPFGILGPHWAESEVKPAGKTSAFPKLGLSVLTLSFSYLYWHRHAFIKIPLFWSLLMQQKTYRYSLYSEV